MGILQQAGGAYGDGALDDLEEGHQILDEPFREARTEEIFQNRSVFRVAQCHRVQFVGLHEFVEDIRTNDHRLGDIYHEILLFQLRITLNHRANERKTTSLAAERPLSDAGEVAVLVEAVFLVNGDHAGVLHAAILHNQVENQLPRLVHIRIVADIDVFQHLCGRKDSARVKEAGEMVAAQVIDQRIVRNIENLVLQILEVLYPHDFLLGLRIDNDKIAEAEPVGDLFAQILRIALRIFVDKGGSEFIRIYPVGGFRRFQHKGDNLAGFPDVLPEFVSGVGVFRAVVHETHVRNDSEDVVLVLLEYPDGFLVGSCQFNLRPTAHPELLLVSVQCLLREFLALLQNELVKVWERGRIEADGVLDQHDNLHAHTCHVMRRVHLVFYQFDDGQQ